MTDLLVILLGAFGFAYIAGHSKITLGLRTWLGGIPGETAEGGTVRLPTPGALGPAGEWLCALLECPACLGFWTGAALSLANAIRAGQSLTLSHLLACVGYGCVVAGFNFIVGRATRLI